MEDPEGPTSLIPHWVRSKRAAASDGLQSQKSLLKCAWEREHAVLAAQVDDDVPLVEAHHRTLAERLVAHDIADLDGVKLLARRTGECCDVASTAGSGVGSRHSSLFLRFLV